MSTGASAGKGVGSSAMLAGAWSSHNTSFEGSCNPASVGKVLAHPQIPNGRRHPRARREAHGSMLGRAINRLGAANDL